MSKIPFRFETDTFKVVKGISQMPKSKAFLIQVFSTVSVHHEGDERSRTNPGHGYPAYNEEFSVIQQFVTMDEKEWEQKIGELYEEEPARKDIVAALILPASIQPKIAIAITAS